MSENTDFVHHIFNKTQLQLLPNKVLSKNTVRSTLELASSIASVDKQRVELFIDKCIVGPSGESIGAKGEGDAKATFDLLKEKISPSLLKIFANKLEQGGYDFRFPLSIMRAIQQGRMEFNQYKDIQVELSDDRKNYSLCPDAEPLLLQAFQLGAASIIMSQGTPLMIAKVIGKPYGKDVALCLRNEGPFVKGVLYSPADISKIHRDKIKAGLVSGSEKVELTDVSNLWYVDRPIWGVPPDTQGMHPVGQFTPLVDHQLSQEFTQYFVNRVKNYLPFSRKPPVQNIEF